MIVLFYTIYIIPFLMYLFTILSSDLIQINLINLTIGNNNKRMNGRINILIILFISIFLF
jgi:hypothetical protein